jgi:hypothetical protein
LKVMTCSESGTEKVPLTGSSRSLVMASLKVRPALEASLVTEMDFSSLAVEAFPPRPLKAVSSTMIGMSLDPESWRVLVS